MTYEQVAYILDNYQQIGSKATAGKTKVRLGTVYNLTSIYRGWVAGKPVTAWPSMVSFFERYQSERGGTSTVAATPAPVQTNDPFARLGNASQSFEQEIVAFIEAAVEQQVGQVRKENEQLQKTIERLQKENNGYQAAFAELKNSNWVDTLRKKFAAA